MSTNLEKNRISKKRHGTSGSISPWTLFFEMKFYSCIWKAINGTISKRFTGNFQAGGKKSIKLEINNIPVNELKVDPTTKLLSEIWMISK